MVDTENSPDSLAGKVALVTGGSRGIGRSICLGLSAQGAKVVVASRTESDTSADAPYEKYGSGTIGNTVVRIEEQGGTGLAVMCDVSHAEDIRRLVDTTLDRFLVGSTFWYPTLVSIVSLRWSTWKSKTWTAAWR
jgi:NAD(P)-dependent dehydrogenase (short-subunit alcohol dehydrogenase family)